MSLNERCAWQVAGSRADRAGGACCATEGVPSIRGICSKCIRQAIVFASAHRPLPCHIEVPEQTSYLTSDVEYSYKDWQWHDPIAHDLPVLWPLATAPTACMLRLPDAL